ncbi:MAG: AI-2E family transporter [Bacteroidetes bacterium]|nr:AI-2E family transporter [Bacteroidota bacterium]MCH8523037.1 AI-2E family transporter [Balneolales bacterium]
MEEQQKYYNYPWYVTYTYALAAVILSVYAMIIAKPLLMPLMFAVFFAILLVPVCNWLERYRIPRFLSAIVSIIITISVIVVLGFFLVSQIRGFVEDADMFADRLEELLQSADALASTYLNTEVELNLDNVVTLIKDYFQENAASLTRGLTGAASTITTFLLMPIFMFLILLFRDMLKTFVRKAFGRGNKQKEDKVDAIISRIKSLIQQYITGLLIVIGILAVINSTMLLIIGVDHAIFFGVFAAMLNVIPFIGPIMGSVLPVLYSLITMDSLLYPLVILLGFYIIQLFESNLFTPVIVGSKVSMNALMTLLLILIGSQIWGLAGMILFIPLGAIMKVVSDEVDSLKPYGYLLGRVDSDKSEDRSKLAKKVREIADKTSDLAQKLKP